MKKTVAALLLAGVLLLSAGCKRTSAEPSSSPSPSPSPSATLSVAAGESSQQADVLAPDFILGADVSSMLALENAGVTFYGFDGQPQELTKILQEAGFNYVRVRVWNDPYDAAGNGYGGGNCNVATAAEIGSRAALYGLKLLVDFHYSDFWADPAKQQAPKAWENDSLEQKCAAITQFTQESLAAIREAGANIGMVQIGNETTNGFCGEDDWASIPVLLKAGASAVRSFDPEIKIAVHFTNPENGRYGEFARLLQQSAVDYDVFASSYYPYWHGTTETLKNELSAVAAEYGKQVMVVETAWPYTLADTDAHPNAIGDGSFLQYDYPVSPEGQTAAITDVVRAISSIGESGIGVMYWEPAWIRVPAENATARKALWELYGAGWASSYAASYDPTDAGVYYGGSACDNQALFDPNGYPLASLRTFANLRTASGHGKS